MKDVHPLATPHLPAFITTPGETDLFLAFATVTLVASVLTVGVLFFWLHSLPERLAHKHQKFQMELIAVLGLLSLITHVHALWVAALVLAFVKIPEFSMPDYLGPLRRVADSVEKLAEIRTRTARPSPANVKSPTDGVQMQPALTIDRLTASTAAAPPPEQKV